MFRQTFQGNLQNLFYHTAKSIIIFKAYYDHYKSSLLLHGDGRLTIIDFNVGYMAVGLCWFAYFLWSFFLVDNVPSVDLNCSQWQKGEIQKEIYKWLLSPTIKW